MRARHPLLLAALALLTAAPAPAQPAGRYEISSIAFEGNSALTRNELLSQMATRESPGFLNKFLHNTISEKLGRKDEFLSLPTLGADLRRLRTYYENRGFFGAAIDTSLAFHPDGGTVDITVKIAENYRSIIDTLSYLGIVNAPGTIWTDIQSSPKIVRGDPYSAELLEEEVVRVLKILANTGYPNARYLRDSSQAVRYASTGNCSVRLRFDLGRMYFFGPIAIAQEIDSVRSPVPRKDITDEIFLQQLTYVPGKRYSIEDSAASASNLNRLGIFDLRAMDMKVPRRSDTAVTVPTSIVFRAKDRHELGPEIIVSDENGALNLGAGLGYTHRNFFGGARLFTTRLRFRTQTLSQFPGYFDADNTHAVSNLDLTAELVQPYVFSNRIKGSWSFSYILDKEIPYLQSIFRNKFGFTNKFTETTNGFLDWTLETVSSRKNATFYQLSYDPVVQQQLLLLQTEQFNSILAFTLQRDVTNDLFSPSDGSITSAEFDEAGLFPLLLQGVFPSLPISQFYRVVLFGRWYTEAAPRRFSIFAFKLKGGVEDKYGGARSDPGIVIPQTHRFYAGGGNSIRGWNSRDLISGGSSPFAAQLGGNLALEGSMELRTNVLQSLRDGLFDRIWLVQFVDAGNVWQEAGDFRLNTIAVAAGIGIRYDTFFGPFRIDWGFRVYNPAESNGQRWITQRRLFGQTFKEAIFHFGIGNAF
ncbi:MAG TPA: BamA/TamA family outer membrane protein [Bacteroidota bacterium]|nr:BamA/TamA family outer membrane protein [Bacteroidota bacterium]